MARAVVGAPRKLTDKFLFRLEGGPFNGSDTGFTTMSELKSSVETVAHRQGGSLIPDKSPGVGTFDPITLTRGATTDIHALCAWYNLVLNGAAQTSLRQGGAKGAGAADELFYKSTIDVVQTDRGHNAIKRWRLFNAWPSELVGIDGLDNNASERAMESLTIEFDYFELVNPVDGIQFNIFARFPGFGVVNFDQTISGVVNIGKNLTFRI